MCSASSISFSSNMEAKIFGGGLSFPLCASYSSEHRKGIPVLLMRDNLTQVTRMTHATSLILQTISTGVGPWQYLGLSLRKRTSFHASFTQRKNIWGDKSIYCNSFNRSVLCNCVKIAPALTSAASQRAEGQLWLTAWRKSRMPSALPLNC